MRDVLSPFSEVVDTKRLWLPDWYSWLKSIVTEFAQVDSDITAVENDIANIYTNLDYKANKDGITDGSDAGAGEVGEYNKSIVNDGSPVTITVSATDTQVTSLTLAAGDWDVSGEVFFQPNGGATVSDFFTAIATSVTTGITPIPADNSGDMGRLRNQAATGRTVISGMRFRASITGSTTYYLVANPTFVGGTVNVYGALRARRMR